MSEEDITFARFDRILVITKFKTLCNKIHITKRYKSSDKLLKLYYDHPGRRNFVFQHTGEISIQRLNTYINNFLILNL